MPGSPHPVSVMRRARELNAAGWNSAEIRRVLAKEGHTVSRYAIYRWVHPDFAERTNEKARERRAERREQTINRKIKELRAAGLSYSALAVVLEHYHDTVLTEEQVRFRAYKLGCERNSNMARAA